MTAHLCPCGTPTPNATLCQRCLDALHRDLDAIADHITEATTQLARLGRHGERAGSRSAERPLPIDLAASEALDILRSVLVGWVRDVTPRPDDQPPDTLRGMARHLRWWDWAAHPAADEFADELHHALTTIRQCIDSPPERHYLGPCGAIDVDGRACQGDVYAVGNRQPRCRDCGERWDADERRHAIAEWANGQLVTATEGATALAAWAGMVDVTPERIRLWAHRGRVTARATTTEGRPLYPFAELRDLAVDTLRHAGKRRDA